MRLRLSHSPNHTPYGKCIKAIRLELGITQQYMASILGYSAQYMSLIENGIRPIKGPFELCVINFCRKQYPKNPDKPLELQRSIDQTSDCVSTAWLSPEQRVLVAALADRLLTDGNSVPPEVRAWILGEAVAAPKPDPKLEWTKDPVYVVRLYDGADGVRGHYCIGRLHPNGYNEWWNKYHFCGAGELFDTKEKALQALAQFGRINTDELW